MRKQILMQKLMFILVIISSVMIFTLSSQTAKVSDKLSMKVSKEILSVDKAPESKNSDAAVKARELVAFNNKVRQLAHSVLYAAFALSLYGALRFSNVGMLNSIFLTLMAAGVISGLDEWNQSFHAGRGMEFKDSVSDMIGAGLALIVGVLGSVVFLGQTPKHN